MGMMVGGGIRAQSTVRHRGGPKTITSPTNPVAPSQEGDVIQRRSAPITISIGPLVDIHDWPPLFRPLRSISHEIATDQIISPHRHGRHANWARMRAADRQAVIACSPPLPQTLPLVSWPSPVLVRPSTSPQTRLGLLSPRCPADDGDGDAE